MTERGAHYYAAFITFLKQLRRFLRFCPQPGKSFLMSLRVEPSGFLNRVAGTNMGISGGPGGFGYRSLDRVGRPVLSSAKDQLQAVAIRPGYLRVRFDRYHGYRKPGFVGHA